MDLRISLQKKQREALILSEITPVLFFGGAKGGGKSFLIRAREVIRRLRFTNSKGLIVRKTYPELLANHIRPFFKEYPQTREWYNKSEKTIYWPNGSTTEFSYLRNTDDVYTYQGREYDDMGVDEVTQHEWEVIRVLRSSLRTTIQEMKPTLLLTGNPGGIGHGDVKRIFIDRDFQKGENPGDFSFVQAFIQDNRALLDADPEYIRRLEDLPEHLRKAYLDGDWNIFAGLSFTELRREVHVIKPFPLTDPRVKWFSGYDWGYSHPFAFVLCAIDADKNIYVTGCVHAQHKRIDEQAVLIRNLVGDKRPTVYSGHDIWAKRGGPTIKDQLRNELPELNFVKAYIDRVQGVAELRKQFAYQNTATSKPKLYFFETALEVFNQVRSMQYDQKKPEDVLKIDANEYGVGGDDLYDALRHAVATWVRPNQQEPEKDPKEEIIEWIENRSVSRNVLEY